MHHVDLFLLLMTTILRIGIVQCDQLLLWRLEAVVKECDRVLLEWTMSLWEVCVRLGLNYLLFCLLAFCSCGRSEVPKSRGDLSHATNWRPLTFLSMLVQLLHSIFARRLSEIYPFHRFQIPFAQSTVLRHQWLLFLASYEVIARGLSLYVVLLWISPKLSTRLVMHQCVVDFWLWMFILIWCSTLCIFIWGIQQIFVGLITKFTVLRCGREVSRLTPPLPFHHGSLTSWLMNFWQNYPTNYVPWLVIGEFTLWRMQMTLSFTRSCDLQCINYYRRWNISFAPGECHLMQLNVCVDLFGGSGTSKEDGCCHGFHFYRQHDDKSIGAGDCMKYFASELGAYGSLWRTIENCLKPIIAVVRVPLKPQQKIELLQISLLFTICNLLSLQMVTRGYHIGLDAAVCKVFRSILHLLHFIRLGFYYAHCREGGLGLTAFQMAVLCLAILHFERMPQDDWVELSSLANEEYLQSSPL